MTVVGWWGQPGMDVPVGTELTDRGRRHVAASMLRNGQPMRIDRFEGPAGFDRGPPPAAGSPVRRIGAPITLEGRLWGVAVAAASQPGRLPAASEWRIAGLTALVATAIADAQAQTDLRRIADEQAALRRVAMLVACSAAPARGLVDGRR